MSYSAAPETVVVDGLLFDMDGTIVDSTDAIVKHWHEISRLINKDVDEIIATSHGRRSIDTLQLLAPELANWDYVCKIEGEIPKKWGQDAVEIPGSRDILEQLDSKSVPWMIVTSGTVPLLFGWLEVMKMKYPTDTVTAADVAVGKPDPSPYLLGRKKLNLSEDAMCLVIEDAPSGVRAGKSAGFKVLALETTHRIEQLKDAGADWIIQDLRSLNLTSYDSGSGKVCLSIKDALVN